MVASYTSNGRITKQGTNDNPNTWGTVLNNQVIELFEEAVFKVAEVDVTGSSNVTLTTDNGTTDQARHATLKFVGVISNDITVFVPSVEKQYFIHAAHTGGDITVKINGSSTEVVLSPDDKKIVYTDGVNIEEMTTEIDLTPYMQKTSNLSDVTSVSESRDNLGLKEASTKTVVEILEAVYPIGSIYLNASSTTNPSSLLGFGTWEAFSEGRVLLGVGTGTDVNSVSRTFTLGQTGGEYQHIQTIPEMAEHFHRVTGNTARTDSCWPLLGSSGARAFALGGTSQNIGVTYTETFSVSGRPVLENTGNSSAMQWMQPYIGVYIWRRTA